MDYTKFKRSYDKYVKLLAKILRDRRLSVEKGLWTHYDVTKYLGGDQWIKNDPSYVKFNKKSTADSSIVGKRVVSKVNNLRFYDVPSWQVS